VYDRNRTRHVWSGNQQRYWTQRRQQWQNRSGTATPTGENWSGWDRSRRHGSSATSTSTGTWNRGSGNWTRSNARSREGAQGSRGDRGLRHRERDD
jgi:hypothetical protein